MSQEANQGATVTNTSSVKIPAKTDAVMILPKKLNNLSDEDNIDPDEKKVKQKSNGKKAAYKKTKKIPKKFPTISEYKRLQMSKGTGIKNRGKDTAHFKYNNKISFEERQRIWSEKKKQKEEAFILKTMEDEEIKCQFIPNINNTSKWFSKTKPSFTHFLSEQAKFLESKKARNEEKVMVPPQSGEVATTRKNQKEPNYMKMKEIVQDSSSFIKKPRRKSVNQLANEDKCVRNKIRRDLLSFFPNQKEQKISFSSFSTLLRQYGLLRETLDKNETTMLNKLWGIVEGDKRVEITLQTLSAVIYAILKASPIGLEYETFNPRESKTSIGKYTEENKFVLTSKDEYSLHKMFKPFYFNKMMQLKQLKEGETYSHSPRLNSKSVDLAIKSRQKREDMLFERKIHEGMTAKYDRVPTLVEYMAVEDKGSKKSIFQKRLEKEAEEKKAWTFQPNRSKSLSKSFTQISIPHPTPLNELCRPLKKKYDLTTNEVDYKKSKCNLTFSPFIHKFERKKSADNIKQSKAFLDSVERVTRANKERERIRLAKSLRSTSSCEMKQDCCSARKSSLHKSTRSSLGNYSQVQKRKELYEIELRISDTRTDKAKVYQGDTPFDVANRLAKKYQLGEYGKEKIAETLKAKMNSQDNIL